MCQVPILLGSTTASSLRLLLRPTPATRTAACTSVFPDTVKMTIAGTEKSVPDTTPVPL